MKSGLPPAARAIFSRSSPAIRSGISSLDVFVAQGLEPKRHRPGGAALAELRPRDAEQQDRCARGEERDVLDQVEERLLAPLDVVEDDDQRPLRRSLLQRLAERPGDLLRRRRRLALAEQRADRHRGGLVRGQHVELLQHLDHRPVRDPLAVGEAAAADDRRLDRSQNLRGQPGLADAGIADDRDQLAALLGPHALPRFPDERELALTSDERRLVPPLRRVAHAQEPVGGNRLGLALQLERLDRLDLDRVARRARASALRPAPRPARAACSSRAATFTASPVASRSSVPVTTSPVMTPIRPSQPELGQRVAHLDRRPHGAQRVVLVQHRHAEHGHHGVADELLHAAAVPLDDRLHPLEVAREQRTQPLRVERLAERGRAGEVAEEDRHRLALLLRPRGHSGEREATLLAELRALAVRMPTARTNQHAYEARPQPQHKTNWWQRHRA